MLAVSGTNQRLAARLAVVARQQPMVITFGFTERIPELMAASDVVVTTSGDTCREARVIGRRMVLLDVVPGHGRENLMHELELGDSAVCLPTASVGAWKRPPAHGRPGHPPTRAGRGWGEDFIQELVATGVALGRD